MKLHRFPLLMLLASPIASADEFVYGDGFEESQRPAPGAVIVTEEMSDPTEVADSSGEWFELTNVGAQGVNLQNCIVTDTTGNVVLPPLMLLPGGAAVVARRLDPGVNGGVSAFTTFSFALGADDLLRLSCGGVLIDETSWTSNESAGRSRSLDPAFANASDNDLAGNWCFSTQLYNSSDSGTPGAFNAPCPGGTPPGFGELIISELMIDPAVLADSAAEWIELQNIANAPRNLAGCVLSNGVTDSAPLPSISIVAGAFALLVRSADTSANGGLAADAILALGLNNSSGTLTIRCNGSVVSTVAWQSSVSGRSLQSDPGNPTTYCVAPPGTFQYAPSNFGTPRATNLNCP